MANYLRGRVRNVLYAASVTDTLWYFFHGLDIAAATGISSADVTSTLGLLVLGGAEDGVQSGAVTVPSGAGIVKGSQNPRPARVTKKLRSDGSTLLNGTDTITSYISHTHLDNALRAGWTLAKHARLPSIKRTGKTITVGVEIDHVIYCWNMNKDDASANAEKLGLLLPSDLDNSDKTDRIVFGANAPRPPRIAHTYNNGTDGSGGRNVTISAYCSPANLQDMLKKEGWRQVTGYVPFAGTTTP